MNDRDHLSSLELDLLHLGSLSPQEAGCAADHLAACPHCRSRAEETAAGMARFDAVRARALRGIEERTARGSLWTLPWTRWAAAGAAVAMATLLLLVAREEPGGLRYKGGPLLQVYGIHQGRVQELHSGDRVEPGDRIRFAADGGGAGFLLVISVDGAGKTTVFAPFGGARSLSLAPGRNELEESVELDASPGPERLFALFSAAALDAAQAVHELTAQPQAETILGVRPVTFVLAKEVVP
ncbi:MAG: hypothetical protein HY901_32755 [Deltaproteobacteria bacterium]|nr:hypothetical protein [Deltaproteobacteria bacterium]